MLNTSDDLYSTTGKFIIIMAREANRLLYLYKEQLSQLVLMQKSVK